MKNIEKAINDRFAKVIASKNGMTIEAGKAAYLKIIETATNGNDLPEAWAVRIVAQVGSAKTATEASEKAASVYAESKR